MIFFKGQFMTFKPIETEKDQIAAQHFVNSVIYLSMEFRGKT